MATQGRREHSGLKGELLRTPERFEFAQAVRLLEHIGRERHKNDPTRAWGGVGHDEAPRNEIVRFLAHASLRFPSGEISKVSEIDEAASRFEMVVTFLGLTGPSGVLPRHYTELLLERIKSKDTSLRDFLDLFNHRLISLFHRAGEKYRIIADYERCRLDDPEGVPDLATRALYSLVGLGTEKLRNRLGISDEIFLHYSGHFAHKPRSAIALEHMLGDYLEFAVKVLQLQGQWLQLPNEDLAVIPSRLEPEGRNNRLGIDLVIGQRVWDIQSKIRIRTAPLRWVQFRSLMPDGMLLRPLSQVVRFYVGEELDFDVQAVLRADAVPECQLNTEADPGPRLGWNTWIRSAPFQRPVDDAVFSLQGV